MFQTTITIIQGSTIHPSEKWFSPLLQNSYYIDASNEYTVEAWAICTLSGAINFGQTILKRNPAFQYYPPLLYLIYSVLQYRLLSLQISTSLCKFLPNSSSGFTCYCPNSDWKITSLAKSVAPFLAATDKDPREVTVWF